MSGVGAGRGGPGSPHLTSSTAGCVEGVHAARGPGLMEAEVQAEVQTQGVIGSPRGNAASSQRQGGSHKLKVCCQLDSTQGTGKERWRSGGRSGHGSAGIRGTSPFLQG